MNEYKKKRNRLIDMENKLVVPVGREKGEEQDKGRGLRGTNYYVQNK